jgi:hypothetical protein
MSVREKGRRRPGSRPHRPFSRPQPPAECAKVRGFSRTASAFTAETDWLLEEGGFEPLVPLQRQHDRGTGPMSPTASIRVALVIPLANAISISVASGTSFPPAGVRLCAELRGDRRRMLRFFGILLGSGDERAKPPLLLLGGGLAIALLVHLFVDCHVAVIPAGARRNSCGSRAGVGRAAAARGYRG